MILNKRFVLSLAVAGLLGITTVAANAESTTRATFSLPMQAYWNDTLLQPGDYTLLLSRSTSGVNVIQLNGEGVTASFVAPAGPQDISGHSLLKIDEINGNNVVRELDAGPLGRAYRFAVGKTIKNQMLRGSISQPVTIPVSTVAGF